MPTKEKEKETGKFFVSALTFWRLVREKENESSSVDYVDGEGGFRPEASS